MLSNSSQDYAMHKMLVHPGPPIQHTYVYSCDGPGKIRSTVNNKVSLGLLITLLDNRKYSGENNPCYTVALLSSYSGNYTVI